MATDYDAPRKTDEELSAESLEDLKAQHASKTSSKVDVDEADLAETLELPGADLSDVSITVTVIPKKADEFTCSRCFLVNHQSQLAKEVKGQPVCNDCA
jgi:formylmethanofuran dehydrogenase subunit E